MSPESRRVLDAANGYAELGLWNESWESIEDMPDGRLEKEPMLLRLRVCHQLEWWDMGENVAGFLASSENPECKKEAAKFFHHQARHFCQAGEIDLAKQAATRACAAWLEIRAEIIEDRELYALW